MTTGSEIEIKLFDVTAKADSQPGCRDKQPFVELDQMRREDLTLPPCATLERDFFRLDGSMEPFPDQPQGRDWGLWSSQMSGEDCRFAQPPVLNIGFAQRHSSIGLTLRFDEAEQDWCRAVRVDWLDGEGNSLSLREFYPDGPVYFLKNKVEGYRALELTFLETRKPCRYLKLAGIDYGLLLVLGSGDITTARLLEETDVSGSAVTVNTLDFTVYSQTGQYSPLNPDGIFSTLQQKQRMAAYIRLGGQRQYMGSYYLDRWESGQRGDIQLHGVDGVGLLDKVQFLGGVYDGTAAGEIIKAVMGAGELDYTIEPGLAAKPLWGKIPVGSARSALWQVAFAVGGVVDCSRSAVPNLYAPPERPSVLIGHDRKFAGQRLRQRPVVTGVEVTAHRFVKSEESAKAFEGQLGIGESTILLNEPMYSCTAVGAVITESGANYLRLQVTTPGKVTVTGKKYLDAKQTVYGPLEASAPNLMENRMRVEKATLVSGENVQEVLDRLRVYYRRGYLCEFDMILGTERTADIVAVKTLEGDNLKGLVESMEIDLAGGGVVRMSVYVERIEAVNSSFAGEFYAGELSGVM